MNYSIVVMFHEIHSSVWFNEVLVHLGKRYKFVNANQLYENIHSTDLCHITFDDGHRSFFENAYPVLYELQIPATLFVSPKVIEEETNYWFQTVRKLNNNDFHQYVCKKVSHRFSNPITDFSVYSILKSIPINIILELIENYESENRIEEEPYMNITKSQLFEVHKSGLIEIGAHTLNHPILANENKEISELEIKESINKLQEILSDKVYFFAYPNGQPDIDFGAREIQILRETDIKLAFSTEANKLTNHSSNFSIPRIGLSKGNILYIDQKIRFAKYWDLLRNVRYRKTEQSERRMLRSLKNNNDLVQVKYKKVK